MQIVTIHNTDTEEIVGNVSSVEPINFDELTSELRKTFIAFHKESDFDDDYSIEDFVDYHNINSNIQIDWVVSDYIQLGESDI